MNKLTRRQRAVGHLIIVTLLLLSASLVWYDQQQGATVQVAVAKGKRFFDMVDMPETALNQTLVQELALADPETADMLAGKEVGFVEAARLTSGEARPWRQAGCVGGNCAHVTFYDYSNGGTINTVVNLDTTEVVDRWQNPLARPGGSTYVLPKALRIAAADPQVRATLGDIGTADPLMIPMSGWLTDSACRQDWCVDLTFHDPAGSGRVFHVFVNMERDEVARTFYTRGRPEIEFSEPAPQRNAFSNGCHEQYGWEVCWEMTAHDGIDFRDATYQGQLIFSSAKIGQIEAWYPSWPGGYRDEIGFSASVPPFGGTEINDLGDSFEVRQLFTEFTRWPNCICCYRYEEIIRFYADGTFEPRFVSHGPGCDDLSLYRPFWRIDLDLNGPENDQVWVWQENEWVEAEMELELFPFVDDVSPDGEKLATFDAQDGQDAGDAVHYRWRMLPTDPLGLDESRVFLLQEKEGEGDGPIMTGPGNTFQPPRQWNDGDSLSGNDIVLWYVALLKTKKGGPWWCMPDPEPGINQCEAILRAEPGGELHQPTEEELAQLETTPTPTITPTPVATEQATATPRPIGGRDAETIILNAGCGSCHKIGSLGEARKVGPDLSNIGATAGERVPGMSAEEYLRQSILAPNAFIAPECPNGPCMANVMPADYETRLSSEQVEQVVTFLLEQRSEETSQPTAGGEPTPAPKAFPAPKRGSQQPVDSSTGLAVQILLLSLVFLLSLFRLLKQSSAEDS